MKGCIQQSKAMKKYIRSTVIAALLLGLTAAPAHADDEALAAFGGFVAGMITGAIIENNSNHHHASVEISYGHGHDYRGPRCGKHNRYSCNSCSNRHHGPKGYWKTTRHKVWVPGHWSVVVNHCGDRVRVWSKGYYTYETKRIWIEEPHRGYNRSRCG